MIRKLLLHIKKTESAVFPVVGTVFAAVVHTFVLVSFTSL